MLIDTFAPVETRILFNTEKTDLPHPNTLELTAMKGGKTIGFMRVMSVGGGDIRIEGRPEAEAPEVYREKSFAEIADYCKTHNKRISDYVEENEGAEIWDFLLSVWNCMKNAIQEGLTHSGVLPGGLNVERKAQYLFNQRHIDERAGDARKPAGLRLCVRGERAERGTGHNRDRADVRRLRVSSGGAEVYAG